MATLGHIIGGPVDSDYDGATLTADLASGDLVLQVDDAGDFDEDGSKRGAELLIDPDLDGEGVPDPSTGSVLGYDTYDDDAGTVALSAASTVTASSGDRVFILDPVSGLPTGRLTVMVATDDGDTTGDALKAYLDVALLESVGDVDLTDLAVDLDEDEDGQLYVAGFPGLTTRQGRVRWFQDYATVPASGDVKIRLTYVPVPNSSVKVSGPGVGLNRDEWDFDPNDPWTIIVPRQAHFHEGEVFEAHYAWTDPTPRPAVPASLLFVGSTVIANGDTTATPPDGSQVGDLFVFVASAGVSFGDHDTTCTDPRVVTQLVSEPSNGNPWPLKQGVAYGILTTLDPVTVSVTSADNSVFAYLATYRITGAASAVTSHGDLTNAAPVACVPSLAGGGIGILAVAANQGGLSAAGWTGDLLDQNLGIWHAEPPVAAHVYRGGATEVEQWTALSIGITEG